MPEANQLLERIKDAGLKPLTVPYAILLEGYTKDNQAGKAEELLRKMNLDPNAVKEVVQQTTNASLVCPCSGTASVNFDHTFGVRC